MPDPLAGREQRTDHPGARCTSCPIRADPGSRASCGRARARAVGRLSSVGLVVAAKRLVQPLADPRRQAEQQVPAARTGPVAWMPWSATHSPSSTSARLMVLRADPVRAARSPADAARPTTRFRSTVVPPDRLRLRPDQPFERRVVRARLLVGRVVHLAPAEVVVLVREAVAPGLLALPLVVDRPERFEEADRVVLVDELFGRQLHQRGGSPTTSTCPRGGASRAAGRAASVACCCRLRSAGSVGTTVGPASRSTSACDPGLRSRSDPPGAVRPGQPVAGRRGRSCSASSPATASSQSRSRRLLTTSSRL